MCDCGMIRAQAHGVLKHGFSETLMQTSHLRALERARRCHYLCSVLTVISLPTRQQTVALAHTRFPAKIHSKKYSEGSLYQAPKLMCSLS